jgi:hypothetical protein
VTDDTNPIVKTLIELRNKFYAHHASREVVSATDLHHEYPVTKAQVTELLSRAHEIVNRYTLKFSANAYSAQIVGHDDYQTVIGAIHWDVECRRAEVRGQTAVRRTLRPMWEEVDRRRREEDGSAARGAPRDRGN